MQTGGRDSLAGDSRRVVYTQVAISRRRRRRFRRRVTLGCVDYPTGIHDAYADADATTARW